VINKQHNFGPSSCAPDEINSHHRIYCIVGYCISQKSHRCFGYYRDYIAACTALKDKWKDIEECLYDIFFIEQYCEGLQPIGTIVDYYEIEPENRELVKKDIPKNFKQTINWTLG